MICSACSKDRDHLIQLVCLNCISQMAKDREMEKLIKTIEEKKIATAKEKIELMRKDQRPEEDILADILALKDNFTESGRKREQELFAEKRKAISLKRMTI